MIAVLLMAPASVVGQWSEVANPSATPATLACDDLASYMEDVYHGTEPPASLEEVGIARAAWRGPYRDLSLSELATAQYIYQVWATNLADVPPRMIPDGMEAWYATDVRIVELHAESITAYLSNDNDAYQRTTAELWEIAEARYLMAQDGVAKCGQQWIDAMGEPWDPSPEATPVASPVA